MSVVFFAQTSPGIYPTLTITHTTIIAAETLSNMYFFTISQGVKPGPVGKMVVVKPVQGRMGKGGLR